MSVVVLARLLCWLPAAVLGVLFIRSCLREPRRFRTAVYPAVFVLWVALVLMALYRQTWALVVLAACVVAGPLLLLASCLLAFVAACCRHRLRLAAVWLLAAVLVFAAAVALPLALAAAAPVGVVLACGLPASEVLALAVAYLALLAHAALYRRPPRRADYDAIVVEPRAMSTEENLRFSRELMDRAADVGPDARVALVSSDFHIFRCMVLARRLEMPLDGVGAPTPAGSRSLLFMRELLSLVAAVRWPYAVIALTWLALCALYVWM